MQSPLELSCVMPRVVDWNCSKKVDDKEFKPRAVRKSYETANIPDLTSEL